VTDWPKVARCEGSPGPRELLSIARAKCEACRYETTWTGARVHHHSCWRDPLFKASIGLPADREALECSPRP
jgi:hypothetical protein